MTWLEITWDCFYIAIVIIPSWQIPAMSPVSQMFHYSSTFNTIVPSKLNTALCDILNVLTDRHRTVRVGSTTSSALTLNTGTPQGCILSPLLYSLFMHDCMATHSSNTTIRFADGMTVISLIASNDGRPTERRSEPPPSQHQQNKRAEVIIVFMFCSGHYPLHLLMC